jgi:hypothetical protein
MVCMPPARKTWPKSHKDVVEEPEGSPAEAKPGCLRGADCRRDRFSLPIDRFGIRRLLGAFP